MKRIVYVILLAFAVIACEDEATKKIKSDLNKRYEKVEIDEIKPDSSYVNGAIHSMRSLSIKVSETNRQIAYLLLEYDEERSIKNKILIYNKIDSIFNRTKSDLIEFDGRKNWRSEKVYSVNYRVAINGQWVVHKEYYFLNEVNGDALHRPIEWTDFVIERDHDKTIKKATEPIKDILVIKYELFKKF